MHPTTSHTITDHFIGPQHPFLGIDPRRCQSQLTLANWQQSGILIGGTYLFIASAFQAKGRVKGFCVNGWSTVDARFIKQTFFTDLDAALDHANLLAQNTARARKKHTGADLCDLASRVLVVQLPKT